jgi:hypothetical protein
MQTIERLKRGVRDWLEWHELDRDTTFYSGEEWRARREAYLANSSLVLVFEGGLYSVMNRHRDDSMVLYDDLERVARGFGYFFELGHAWSMGFYPLPGKSLDPDLGTNSE